MAFIQVDYLNAVAQAKKLENAAEKCAEAAREIKTQGGNSEQFWVGRSGDAMRTKLAESVSELTAAQNALLAAAANIRRVAEEMKETDQSIANIIRTGG